MEDNINVKIFSSEELISMEKALFADDITLWAKVIYELNVVRGFHRNYKAEWSRIWSQEDQKFLVENEYHILDDTMFFHTVWHY